MDKIVVKLKHERSTKGTEVYLTNDKTAAVTNLYVSKAVFGGAPPSEITVTITV